MSGIFYLNKFKQLYLMNKSIKITTFCSLKKKRITKYSKTSTVLSSNLKKKKKKKKKRSLSREPIGYIVSWTKHTKVCMC